MDEPDDVGYQVWCRCIARASHHRKLSKALDGSQLITELTYAQAFPLVRAGGVFLSIVGMGIIIGGVLPRFRRATLAVSGVIAVVVTTSLAHRLAAPFGAPTALQVWSLVGAVALELALIPLVVRRFRPKGPRTVTLAVMLVVGVHFLPMSLAFGPVMYVLALLVCIIGVSGLVIPHLPLNALWGLDGIAKLGAGAVMWFTGA